MLSAGRMVHDDVYKIIKYTVQKTMSGELAQRALDWWAGLVEHLFGLPARTPEQEKAVVPAAEDHSGRNKVLHCLTSCQWWTAAAHAGLHCKCTLLETQHMYKHLRLVVPRLT